MNLDRYQELSGLQVKETDRAFVTANLSRARTVIENAIGFPLDPEKAQQNLYTERGKAPSDNWVCGWSDADLLPADEEADAIYRVFEPDSAFDWAPYADPLYRGGLVRIDPCTAVSTVKLVHGDVTLHTYDTDQFALVSRGASGRLLDLNTIFPQYHFHRSCRHRLQVAVSADWLGIEQDDLPDDLLTIWADLATSLSDRSGNIKSESLGTRSYTKFAAKSPLEYENTKSILSRYAGPRGTAGRLPV